MVSKRILVIDDEPTVRAIVQVCLSELGGYEVVEAASGSEGLLKAEEEHPDAIVLDLCMPGMDGVEVLQKLRASQATLSIPVVVLSAIATLATSTHTLKDKVADVIPKPFNPLTLSNQIAVACHWI